VEDVVAAVLDQVDHVLIVDNGSDELTLASIQHLRRVHEPGVTCILNGVNRGIATALNQAARYAVDNGHAWLLTLDHDSHASPRMVADMLEAYDAYPDRSSVGIIAPNSTDTISGEAVPPMIGKSDRKAFVRGDRRSAVHVVRFVHTSGNLVLVNLFRQGFWFRDDFFIDCVDFEYCLKIRSAGYTVVVAIDAGMAHTIGNERDARFLGRPLKYSSHAPRRQYYMLRNALVLFRETRDMQFATWYFRDLVIQTGLTLVFEPLRITRARELARGFLDGVANRVGERT
jgi:rhamnosyltransferase